METFVLLFAHNAWANQRVIDGCAKAPPGFLGDAGNGFTADTILQRLQHQLVVERGFLDAVNGDGKMPEAPMALVALTGYSRVTADGYAAFCARLDEAAILRNFNVPWWGRDFAVREGLVQALGHSGQHRAEIAWELAKAEVDTGNLDYIVWTASGRPSPNDPWPPPGQ